MHSPIDEAARNLLNSKLAELETYLNADVIVYYGEIFDSVEIQMKKIVEELQSEKRTPFNMLYYLNYTWW